MGKETTYKDFLEDDDRPSSQSTKPPKRERYYAAGETRPWLGRQEVEATIERNETGIHSSPAFHHSETQSIKHIPSPYDALGGHTGARSAASPGNYSGYKLETESVSGSIYNISNVKQSSSPRAISLSTQSAFPGMRSNTSERHSKLYRHPAQGPSANYAYNYDTRPLGEIAPQRGKVLVTQEEDHPKMEPSHTILRSFDQISSSKLQNTADKAIQRIHQVVQNSKSQNQPHLSKYAADLNQTPTPTHQEHQESINLQVPEKYPSKTVAESAPFATHFAKTSTVYNSFQPTEAAELMDRYGYHYEGLGDYPNKHAADAMIAATRNQKEKELEGYLLRQMDEKKRLKAMDKRDQLLLEQNSQLSLIGIGGDEDSRAQKRKQQRRLLEAEWLKSAAEKKERDEAERRMLKPWEENWNILEAQARSTELHNLSAAERQRREEQLRLENWRSAQERKAEEMRAMEEERRRIEELTLSPNVANYAERIVLADEQKRRDQQRYKQQLDEQVRAKHLKNKLLAAEQFELECRIGSY